MKPESLEILLCDRALGALAPEVAELLDAHLVQSPAAAARAASVTATVALARQAVAGPTRGSPLGPPRWQNPSHRWRSVPRSELLRLAACLAFGLLAGWAAASRTAAPSFHVPRPVVASAEPRPAAQPAGMGERPSAANRLIAVQPRADATDEPRYRLRWESPLKTPRWEEKP